MRKHDPELDQVISDDLNTLVEMRTGFDSIEVKHLRLISPILRRHLLHKDVEKAASARRLRLLIGAPDNGAFIKSKNKKAIGYYQTACTTIFGVQVAHALMQKGPVDTHGLASPDFRTEKSIDRYLNQSVLIFRDRFIKRIDILKFVANRTGGDHYGESKTATDELLEEVRNVISFNFEEGMPAIRMDSSAVDNPTREFKVTKGALDGVSVEFLSMLDHYLNSSSVRAFHRQLAQGIQ